MAALMHEPMPALHSVVLVYSRRRVVPSRYMAEFGWCQTLPKMLSL